MIIFKAYQSWVHLGPMPIFRALVLDGATYYLIFILAYTLQLIGRMSNVVCMLHFTCVQYALTHRI